jgi:hypothetical protein
LTRPRITSLRRTGRLAPNSCHVRLPWDKYSFTCSFPNLNQSIPRRAMVYPNIWRLLIIVPQIMTEAITKRISFRTPHRVRTRPEVLPI